MVRCLGWSAGTYPIDRRLIRISQQERPDIGISVFFLLETTEYSTIAGGDGMDVPSSMVRTPPMNFTCSEPQDLEFPHNDRRLRRDL